MNIVTHSHNDEARIIPMEVKAPLLDAIGNCEIPVKTLDAKRFRKLVLEIIKSLGWSNSIPVMPDSRITITAVKSEIGLCLQLGNMARFYADLLKLQYFYDKRKLIAGIYIIPTKRVAKKLGSNIANFERLTHELNFYDNIIKIPMLIIGLEEE